MNDHKYPNNNVFQFATKELSQDAMICWLVNNFNYPEQDKELYTLSISLLRTLMGKKAPAKIETVRILPQYNNIDVLLIVNHKIAVIVEDKVWSSEHDDQIDTYRNSVAKELADPNKRKELLDTDVDENDPKIVTVYFKTGFWYDNDVITGSTVDVCVDGSLLLSLLQSCHSNHPFFQDFTYRLEHIILQEYVDIKKRFEAQSWKSKPEDYYMEYLILDSMFPQHGKQLTSDDVKYKVKRIYGGSNRDGSSWNEYKIWAGKYPGDAEYSSLFWRVDNDNEGLYVSLRHYDPLARQDKAHQERKEKAYDFFHRQIDQIVAQNGLSELTSSRKFSGKYKESDLLTMYLTSNSKNAHSLSEIQRAVAVINNDIMKLISTINTELEIEKSLY